MVVVNDKRMNLLSEKWQEVYNSMSIKTQNRPPDDLFRQRRPLESLNNNALDYRLANYRNVSKSAFDLAIDQTIEVANTIDVSISYGEKLQAYLDTYRLFDGYKIVTLKQWVIDFVGRYRQTDPNSLVVILPKHNSQLLNPSYDSELPNFNAVVNENIQTETWLVPYSDIVYIDDYEFEFKAGAWICNEKGRCEPYYFRMTKDSIILRYPELDSKKNKVTYIDYAYYSLENYNLNSYPAYIVGGKSITWSDQNGEILTYYVSDFDGASKIADLVIGQMSDLQIVETRFTFPEKWIMKKECPAIGCMPDPITNIHMVDGKKCGTCGGSGFISDTTPLGTHVMTDKDRTDNGGIVAPVGFITPDTAILDHSAKRVEYYTTWVMRELGLNAQNMTNQSGESKRYDMMQKVTLVTAVVTDIYRLLENVLFMTAKYIGDNEEVTITLPEDLDVKNADDLKDELSQAKTDDLPYPAIVELTKRYMLAKFGKNEYNRKKIDYLALYDKLFVYGIEDMTQAVALFGSDITARDKMLHLVGWQMLDEIDGLVDLTNAEINTQLNTLLEPLIPTQVQSVPLGSVASQLTGLI